MKKFDRTTIIRFFINEADIDHWSDEQIAKVYSAEIQIKEPVCPVRAVLEKNYEHNCYCLVYYDRADDIRAFKLIARMNKKLIQLRKLRCDLKIIGRTA